LNVPEPWWLDGGATEKAPASKKPAEKKKGAAAPAKKPAAKAKPGKKSNGAS
jgi:hypothetical protein